MRFGIWEQNTKLAGGKEKIFLSCRPEDQGLLPEIAADFFTALDGIVYFELAGSSTPDYPGFRFPPRSVESGRDLLLEQMDLVCIAVSRRLLEDPEPVLSNDLPLLRRQKIPVLFVLTEPGLIEDFNRIFGNCQAMEYYREDYRDRLRAALLHLLDDKDTFTWAPARKAYVPKEDTLQETERFFTSRLFLSYRKKDRERALLLLRLIHSFPECRDIGIWFDDFLTEGEEFTEEISRKLRDSDAVLLAVTPHILEKGNYVLETEYPEAIENGKKVIPVMIEETDLRTFRMNFPDLPDPLFVTSDDGARLLRQLLCLLYGGKEVYSSQKKWILGRAFMDGLLAERDRELGLALIGEAAEEGCLPALDRMLKLCIRADSADMDYSRAIYYTEKALAQLSLLMRQPDHDPGLPRSIMRYTELLGDLCLDTGSRDRAEQVYRGLLSSMQDFGPDYYLSASTNPGTVYHKLALIHAEDGDYEEAIAYYRESEKYLSMLENSLGNPLSVRNHALMLMNCGMMYEALNQVVPQKAALEYAIDAWLSAFRRFLWLFQNYRQDSELAAKARTAVLRLIDKAESVDSAMAERAREAAGYVED